MPYQKRQKQKNLAKERLGFSNSQPLLIVSGVGANKEAGRFISTLVAAIKKLPITVLNTIEGGHQAVEANQGVYEASDMILFLTKDQTVWPDVEKAIEYKVVPICLQSEMPLTDYDPCRQKGNAFLYKNLDEWEIFAAVVRAVENYKFPYDWGNIVGENLNF